MARNARNAAQSSTPTVAASSVNPDTTRTAKVTINGEIKEFTCTVAKAGPCRNKYYHLIEDYVDQDGVTQQKKSIINGYYVTYDSENNLSFIENVKNKKKTYFDASGNEADPPVKNSSNKENRAHIKELEEKFKEAKEALEAAQKACIDAELAYLRAKNN